MGNERIAVIAGSHSEFLRFKDGDRPLWNKDFPRFFYVSNKKDLIRFRGRVVLYGTYWKSSIYDFYHNEYSLYEVVHFKKDGVNR